MTEEEMQAKMLSMEEELNTLKTDHQNAKTEIAELRAANAVLKDNNHKLFARTSFAEPPKKEEAPPEPQGLEAIKNYIKEGRNG